MFIEASILLDDIVLDCTAMTSEAFSTHFGLWKWFIAFIVFRPQLGIYILLCGLFYVGASICACRSVGCYVVALKEDKKLFFAFLTPMVPSLAVSSPL